MFFLFCFFFFFFFFFGKNYNIGKAPYLWTDGRLVITLVHCEPLVRWGNSCNQVFGQLQENIRYISDQFRSRLACISYWIFSDLYMPNTQIPNTMCKLERQIPVFTIQFASLCLDMYSHFFCHISLVSPTCCRLSWFQQWSQSKATILVTSRKHAYIILTPLNPTFV